MINILLIGCGPHARRIHVPIVNLEQKNLNVKIDTIVDLVSQKNVIDDYLKKNNYGPYNLIYLNKKEQIIKKNTISRELSDRLDLIVKKRKINAVFISTEPCAHVAYAKWALKNGLNILMDKPISTPLNLASSMKSVKQLSKDYTDLLKLYRKQKKKYPNLVFELLTQRRYHVAFQKIRELIDEVVDRTGVPITAFQTMHCDGQWRMPSEIIEQDYHPYNQGYGKCSHSGYHSIDIIDWLIRSSIRNKNQKPKKIEVTSNFMYPKDFVNQLPYEEYSKLFDVNDPIKYELKEYKKLVKDYGEIDAQIDVCYKNKDNDVTTIGQYSLLHNSFSQRDWPNALGRDLYKGNGRIRHEMHYLVQGPFQTIIYESYQSEEILNEKTNHSNIGGEYHLDIHVFRNSKMFKDWKSYEKISLDDLENHILKGYSRGHQEDARRAAIVSFIKSITDNCVVRFSDIEDQEESIAILSSIYKSALLRKHGKNPLVVYKKKKEIIPLYKELEERPYPKHQYMDKESVLWLEKNLNIKINSNKIKDLFSKYKKYPIKKLDFNIKAYEKNNSLGIHGIRHQLRVSLYIWLLVQYYNIKIKNEDLIELLQASLYHDLKRKNDNTDKKHGMRSAKWIKKNYNYIDNNIIEAISNHDSKTDNNDIYTVLIKTADALDRYRLPKEKWWIKKEYLFMNIDEEILEICKYITLLVEKKTYNINDINKIIEEFKLCLKEIKII